ncbi:MAG: metal-sensitive transcriptional regulator [Acidobacteria bacterium]|nr:metal-sensitive transcriptional regulator [Acidobacteriota bacterium]
MISTTPPDLPTSIEDQAHAQLRRRRAQGQPGGVITMIERGGSCDEVVTQLAAVSKAVSITALTLVATGLRDCLTAPADPAATLRLQKTLLSIA